MNEVVVQDFNAYLQLTGDKTAAANLALAAALRESRPETPAPAEGRPRTVPEVAKHLRVSPDKVLGWIRSGRLRAMNISETEGGRPKYRVGREDLDAFLQGRSFTAQPVRKGRPAGRRKSSLPVVLTRPTL
jgi:excisionase family DNA binding protein